MYKDIKYKNIYINSVLTKNIINDGINNDINDFVTDVFNDIVTNHTHYTCYDNRQYDPIYTHQFSYDELNDMNDENINKLYLLYRIEDPIEQGGKLLRFFTEDESSNVEEGIFRFPIKKFYKANLDLTKTKAYFKDNPYKYMNNNIKKEIRVLTILYFYYIVNTYGYKDVLKIDTIKKIPNKIPNKIPKKIPDIHNLPQPIVTTNKYYQEPSFIEFIEKYNDWYNEQFLQQIFAQTALNDYTSYGFKNLNSTCSNSDGINFVDETLVSQLLNTFSIASETPCDLMVYKFYTTSINNLLVENDIYMEKRFMSTTLNINLSKKYDRLNLFLPQGTACINLIENGVGGETEILLPPGTKFKIYKTELNGKYKIYHAELL